MLGQLNEKEQEGAMMEVQLLKNLQHPNIVGYKSSYIDSGVMVIIMEYCEGKLSPLINATVGDLNYHVKRKERKEEFFTETEIFNWFV